MVPVANKFSTYQTPVSIPPPTYYQVPTTQTCLPAVYVHCLISCGNVFSEVFFRAKKIVGNTYKNFSMFSFWLIVRRRSAMAVANFLALCSLLILTVLLKSSDFTSSVYQDNCLIWSNCRSVTRSFLEWVAGVNVNSWKGTWMPSAILDFNSKSRFCHSLYCSHFWWYKSKPYT